VLLVPLLGDIHGDSEVVLVNDDGVDVIADGGFAALARLAVDGGTVPRLLVMGYIVSFPSARRSRSRRRYGVACLGSNGRHGGNLPIMRFNYRF
jgi:hypothetical protein